MFRFLKQHLVLLLTIFILVVSGATFADGDSKTRDGISDCHHTQWICKHFEKTLWALHLDNP